MVLKRLFLFLFLISWGLMACLAGPGPKREMRSAWVTTVWGLDWPGTKIPLTGSQTSAINAQKTQFITLIEALKSANINSIFFQVRSECDAMYLSSYEPWSAYLLAARQMASDFTVDYDPLQFVLEECHKRGIEVHAWLNPYRFESTVGKYAGQAGDYRLTHPEWVLEYDGGGSILDPGNPGVRQRITDIVTEIITNYDVDGVVFDDYFYAYGGTPSTLDQYSQSLYKPSSMALDDWRRNNVNQMVAQVYNAIQSVKPWVTFGLSPFGIWTTNPSVAAERGLTLPEGITGMDAYSSIYCDPVAWLETGTVDYVSPQLYWPTTSTGQDYKKLAPWWSAVANKYHRHFYSSHSLSSLEASSYAPPADLKSSKRDTFDLQGLSLIEYFSRPDPLKVAPTEFGSQIYWNRTSDLNGAPGSVFFRASQFYTAGFINYLKEYEFQFKSLPPAINWKEYQNRSIPSNLRVSAGLFLWDSSEENVRFVVYAIPNELVGEPGVFATNEYLLDISYQKSFDMAPYSALLTTHTLGVSVMDRYGNEFPPALMGYTPVANEPPILVAPEQGQDAWLPFSFQWNAVPGAEGYLLEVARDAAFEQVVYRREITGNSFYAGNISLMNGDSYYWRVWSRKVGVGDLASETRLFRFVDKKPEILTPVNNATNLSVVPAITWSSFGDGFTYRLQIAPNATFTSVIHEVNDLSGLEYQIPPGVLIAYSTYYLRVQARMGDHGSVWSETVKFSTVEQAPSVPVVLSPLQGATVDGVAVTIGFSEDPLATGFRVEISTSSTFPALGGNKKVVTTGALEYSVLFEDLMDATWYARVRANYGTNLYTNWSEVVSFTVLSTDINDPERLDYRLVGPGRLRSEGGILHFQLPEGSDLVLYVTDIYGRTFVVLEKGYQSAGRYHISLNPSVFPHGISLITLDSKFGRKTIKLIK